MLVITEVKAREIDKYGLGSESISDFKKQNKDLFDEDVRGIIKSRLPNYSKMKHEKEAQDELIEMLSARYGVKGVGALKEALEKERELHE